MKTIKLIDLFIKIANGEDTPNAIKFDGKIFTNNGTGLNSNYYCGETDKILEDSFVFEELNEEVEIIEDTSEEDEKIEKLSPYEEPFLKNGAVDTRFLLIIDQLSEIIDKINGDSNERDN